MMETINLKDFYPELYKHDEDIQVSDEAAETLLAAKRKEAAYLRKLICHKAYYSLDYAN